MMRVWCLEADRNALFTRSCQCFGFRNNAGKMPPKAPLYRSADIAHRNHKTTAATYELCENASYRSWVETLAKNTLGHLGSTPLIP